MKLVQYTSTTKEVQKSAYFALIHSQPFRLVLYKNTSVRNWKIWKFRYFREKTTVLIEKSLYISTKANSVTNCLYQCFIYSIFYMSKSPIDYNNYSSIVRMNMSKSKSVYLFLLYMHKHFWFQVLFSLTLYKY